MEYLGHVLPRAIFRPVTKIFEPTPIRGEGEGAAGDRDDVAESIGSAWRWGDGWLRACAVRTARYAPSLDPGLFASGGLEDAIVSAELAALSAAGPRENTPSPIVAAATARGSKAC
jgi:hypothetical protein